MQQTPLEELLTTLWQEVLGRQAIGIHENFFEVGGHSLSAARLISRVRAVLHVELPLRGLFEAPTIAQLAKRAEQALYTGKGMAILPPLLPASRTQELPLSFAQQRLWFLNQLEPGNAAYVIPFAVNVSGKLDMAVLRRCVQEIVCRHEILRTNFVAPGGRPQQIIRDDLEVEIPLLDVCDIAESRRSSVVSAFIRTISRLEFDLHDGPLFRMHLIRTGEQEHVIVLIMHHIISDAWSQGIFIHEIALLYTAFMQGEPAPLIPLPVQYADFAVWQRNWLQGQVLQSQLDYWKKQLAGAIPLDLPTDRPRPPAQSFRGAAYSFALPEDLARGLVSLGQGEGVTLFMTLLSAFQTLLYYASGQIDVVVGTDLAGRNQIETEALIGFFINLLVLRTDLHGAPTFRKVLSRVRSVVLDAYAHQDIPFEMLVEHLRLERKSNQTPLVQILFVMQNTPVTAESLPGMTIKPVSSETVTAKFDLAVFMRETPEGIRGTVNYSTDLFDVHTIAALMNRFIALLQRIVDKPDTSIDLLDIYTDIEKQEEEKMKKERMKKSFKKIKSAKGKEIDIL
jgi:acyl carrier protein